MTELPDRRRPAITGMLVLRAVLVWLAISATFVFTRWKNISTLDFDDVDDELRLVQLRDLAHGQGWFDLHQYRIDPPQGTLMHWSRLVDLPLLLSYRLFTPLLGTDLGERVTLVLVPLVTLGIAMFLVARLAWRLFDLELAALVCVVLAMLPAFAGQVQPLRIDHHGWQLVAVLAALNGLAARNAATGGWIAGIALALGLSISLELLPIAALFGAVMALRWLNDPRAGLMLSRFATALALAGGLVFLATRGLTDLASHCDAVSPPYLAGFFVIALGIGVLAKGQPQNRVLLVGGLTVTGLAAIGTVIGLAPACAQGPFVALDPLVMKFWYANVYEGRPVWLQPPGVMVQMIVPPLIALWASVRLWKGSDGWLAGFWRDYALLLGGLWLMGIVVSRSMAFSASVAVVPLAWLIREWLRAYFREPLLLRRIGYLFAVIFAVIPGAVILLIAAIHPPKANQRGFADPMRVCNVQSAARQLDQLAPAKLFAPLDIGPTLLTFSQHSVIATGHHRAPVGMRDVIAAYTAEPEQARALIAKHRAQYVVLCPALPEAMNYQAAAPNGLAAQLMRGQAPTWLKPIVIDSKTGVLVWKVDAPIDR